MKPAVKSLPVQSRTRRSNIVLGDGLPRCFKLYPEDISHLSREIKRFLANPHLRTSYRFYFLWYKFGQQQQLPNNRPSSRNVHLNLVVRKPAKIIGSSLHYAINYAHTDSEYSLFWSRPDTAQYLTGRDTKRYPLFGLSEIGNVTSLPHNLSPLLGLAALGKEFASPMCRPTPQLLSHWM